MNDHSELKRKAEAATQGEWVHWKHGVIKGGPTVEFFNGKSQQQIAMTTGAEWMRDGEQAANADFIAAASPAVVQGLIADIEALSHWRDLALQFDNHRMAALWHLKRLVVDPQSRSCAELFLSEPPLSAHEVVAERDQARAECEVLRSNANAHKLNMDAACGEIAELRKALSGIRESLEREYWSEYAGLDDTRAILDAAMGKGERPCA